MPEQVAYGDAFERYAGIDPHRATESQLADLARSRGSITWIVPVDDGGVVLVDTGYDDEARAILREVGLVGRDDAIAGFLAHGEQRQLEVGLALVDAVGRGSGVRGPSEVGVSEGRDAHAPSMADGV
mgnify:CR=1 FL=1